ncbi:LysR family transcriptional regulator [Tropicimonas sp. TH_r6]|uniref:LysR family transcriptional regulator n=1 Tax=Tropicimonas sp. TH_r6 TaxID=3082085 RepID=UPI002953059A|nr:LysR family transcriptional regulator [Tropicimonas sp. TH_r6]MDV7145232.1 LysR family transcriptional regulator [Tropicimonas sp. TH_r6]
MDSRFIRTLVAVVETGSFAAAARLQQLTPAAVTQRVRSLEAELGESLVVRAGQRVAPTPACLASLPRLRRICAEMEQLATDLDQTGLSGEIRLGAISTALSDRIPALLARLPDAAPGASLHIVPGTSRELFERLSRQEIDAAFLIRPPFEIPKALGLVPIETQPFVLIIRSGDDRSAEEIIATDRALVYDTASWGGRLLAPWLKGHVAPERILCELDALEAIASAVARGLGYAVVPDWRGLSRMGSIRRVSIPEIQARREMILLHRNLRPDGIAILRDEDGSPGH